MKREQFAFKEKKSSWQSFRVLSTKSSAAALPQACASDCSKHGPALGNTLGTHWAASTHHTGPYQPCRGAGKCYFCFPIHAQALPMPWFSCRLGLTVQRQQDHSSSISSQCSVLRHGQPSVTGTSGQGSNMEGAHSSSVWWLWLSLSHASEMHIWASSITPSPERSLACFYTPANTTSPYYNITISNRSSVAGKHLCDWNWGGSSFGVTLCSSSWIQNVQPEIKMPLNQRNRQ